MNWTEIYLSPFWASRKHLDDEGSSWAWGCWGRAASSFLRFILCLALLDFLGRSPLSRLTNQGESTPRLKSHIHILKSSGVCNSKCNKLIKELTICTLLRRCMVLDLITSGIRLLLSWQFGDIQKWACFELGPNSTVYKCLNHSVNYSSIWNIPWLVSAWLHSSIKKVIAFTKIADEIVRFGSSCFEKYIKDKRDWQ